jgi:hypothetical protein
MDSSSKSRQLQDLSPFLCSRRLRYLGQKWFAESERSKLNTDTRDEGAAASASDKTGSSTNATDTISQKDDNGSPALKKGRSVFVSATLYDGTLLVPSFKLCEQI